MIPRCWSSDPWPETELKMQLRMKMLLLGAQSGCNKLCKAGDRVCTSLTDQSSPSLLLALCSPQCGGDGCYWPELVCSKLLSSEFPGLVRKQAGAEQQPDFLPGHVCPSHVLSIFCPGENSPEKLHQTSVMKRHQAGSGTSIFMEGFCCGIPCNNSAPSGSHTKYDQFSQDRHHSCSSHCNGFAGTQLPAFSRTCWRILIPLGGEQIQLRFSVHE